MSGTEVEIGVWVDGSQKWVSGVTRRTTCHDLIRALLRAQGLRATDADVISHTIVERWKKVERPLDHEQRILKVWRSWGDAVHQVRFSLRRGRSQDTSPRDDGGGETGPKKRNRNGDDGPDREDKENDHQQHHHHQHESRDPSNNGGEIGEDGGGCGGTTSLDEAESSCGRSERSRRRHRMRQSRREAGAYQQQQQQQRLHPHYHRRQSPQAGGSDESVDGAGVERGTGGVGGDLRRSGRSDPRYSETMERLMRLVVAQGETIQTQLRRLSQRETQIETYEQQMHLLRVQSLGTDYLLSSYLHDQQQQHQPMEFPAGGGGIGQGYAVPHQGGANQEHYPDLAPKGSGGAALRSQGAAELVGTGGPMRPRPRDHDLIHGLPPAREVHARPINIQDNGTDLYVNNFTDAIPANTYAENMFCRTNLRSSFDCNPARLSGRLNRVSNKDEAISEEKSNDSGVVVGEESLNYSVEEKYHSDFDNLTEVEVQERIVLLSKVEDVLDRLLREEEVIQGLSSTLEVIQTQQMQETAELEADLTRAAEDHSALVAEARKNEQEIRVLDTSAAQKKKLIDALLKDEVDSDQETRYLQAQLDYILHLPPTAFRLPEEGDDPPPLLPPPVLPACLIQSLHPNQPPQLSHPTTAATLTSTGLHSFIQLPTAKRREGPTLRQQSPQQRFPVNTYIARPPSPVVLMGHRAPSPTVLCPTRAPSPNVRFANRSCSPNKRKPLQLSSYGHLRHSNVTLSSVDVRSGMHVRNNCNFNNDSSSNNNNNNAKKNDRSLNSANTLKNLVSSSLPSLPNRTNPLTIVNNSNNPMNPNKSSLNNGLIKDERLSNIKRKGLPSYGVNEDGSDDTPPPLPSCPPPSLTPPIKTSVVITSSTTNDITDTLNNNDKSKKIPNNFANDTAKRNFLNSIGGRLQNKTTGGVGAVNASLRHDRSADDEDNDSTNTGIGSFCVSSRSSTSSEASISNCSSSASSAPVSSDSGGGGGTTTAYLKPLAKVNNNLQRMQRITNPISVTTTAKNSSSSMRMKEKLINANRVSVGVTTSEKKDVDSADSNSDTGLSSLHSSSDEGGYPLDTLV